MQRVDLETQHVGNYSLGRQWTSGTRWRGVRLDRGGSDSPELPEGYLLSPAVTLIVKPAKRLELYVPERGWKTYHRLWNTVSFFPARMPYACRCEGATIAILVQFTTDFFRGGTESELPANTELPTYWSIEDNLLAEIVLALDRDAAAGSPGGSLYGECLGAALVAHLIRQHSAQTSAKSAQLARLPASSLKNVIEYINDNLSSDLSLLCLANMVKISTHHFLRVFKQHTGFSPHQYVLRKRIERAQWLLNDPQRTITDVALQTGFSDQSHFSTVFRRVIGISPRTYRQSRRR